MPFPTAPVDNSGGILTIGYTDGTDEHFLKVHVKPFTTTVPTTSPYAWSYVTAAGSEASVAATAENLAAKLQPLYHSDWTFWVEGLERVVAGVATPVFPVPLIVTHQSGTGGTAVTLSDPARFCRSVYDLDTAQGGRLRLSLAAAGVRELQVPEVASAAAGGIDTTNDPALVAYLTGGNCAILGHDGHQAVGVARISVEPDRRLRRKYGFA